MPSVLGKLRGGQTMPVDTWDREGKQKLSSGTVYHWPLLSTGPDGVVQPNLGLSDQLVAVSLSLKHTERLLKPTPLPSQDRPLAQRTLLRTASVDVAFRQLALRDLVAFTVTDNVASRRVMEKVGFRYERDFMHHDLAHVLYRLLAP